MGNTATALPLILENPLIRWLQYQDCWLKDKSRFKAGMFSRQSGKTLTACAEAVEDCLLAEAAGKRTRWVILSRGERQAAEAINNYVKPLVKAFYEIYRGVASPQYHEVEYKFGEATYRAFEVEFPNGSKITAIPANPDTARGFSANVILDEFAFHKDSREIWKALFPVISAGFKLRVISTPNGKGNKFYEIMTGKDDIWSRHVVNIYEAVKQDLPRNIEELRRGMGDEDAWAQEYELQWLDEASAWLDFDLITQAEHELAGDPSLYQGGLCFLGNDIARRNDLWVLWIWESVGDVLWTREIIAKRRISFSEQDDILDDTMKRYRVSRLVMDQTGMGEKPVEDAKRRYGSYRVEGVVMSPPRQLDIAIAAKQKFEDHKARIPMGDPVLRSDLHKIKKAIGPTGAPRLITDRDSDGHADRAWAAMMGIAGADGGTGEYAYHTLRNDKGDADAFADPRWGHVMGAEDGRFSRGGF